MYLQVLLYTISLPRLCVLSTAQREGKVDAVLSSFSNGKTFVSTDKSRKKNKTILISSEQRGHLAICPSAFINFRHFRGEAGSKTTISPFSF